jgi:broad specificity phosphatase PhoE
MRIYLITHAHTEAMPDVAADVWRLSERGQAQAAALAACAFWGEVDCVVVTSEAKTWLTVADMVQGRKLPVWIDGRLDELRRGGWVEDYASQVSAAFAAPVHSIGGWESIATLQQRAQAAIDDLAQRFRGKTLALVGHGICLSTLRATWLGLDRVDFVAWQRLSFATYATVNLDPLRWERDFPQAKSPAR